MNQIFKYLLSFFGLIGLVLGPISLAAPSQASAGNTGSIHIRSWVDTDGNNQYSLQEGLIFKGLPFSIVNLATKKPVNPKSCQYDTFNLGGVGRNTCANLPYGKYMVTMLGIDPFQFAGPVKSRWNPQGVNPIAVVEIKPGFRINTLDFGYTRIKHALTGDMIVHAYFDKNNDGQWSGYSSGEGSVFANTRLSIKNAKTGQNIPYNLLCHNKSDRLGGAGENVCRGLPVDDYIVTFHGAGNNWRQVPGTHNQSASNPMKVTVRAGDIVVPEFGYRKKTQGAVINVRVFEDRNHNHAYTVGGGEGKVFAGKHVRIVDAHGKQIDYSRCSTKTNALGGAGRIWCAVPTGAYQVWFADFDANTWYGPIKSTYNPQGVDPVPVYASPGSRQSVVDFGFIPRKLLKI